MCLVPGIADGRFLIDDACIKQEHLTHAACLCGGCVSDEPGLAVRDGRSSPVR